MSGEELVRRDLPEENVGPLPELRVRRVVQRITLLYKARCVGWIKARL
jgi:hypothetical protein